MTLPSRRAAWNLLRLAPIVVLPIVAAGCLVRARPVEVEGGVVVEDDGAYDYSLYPRYDYNGVDVYLVGDRWYYRDGGRWAYFRHEPPALFGYRRNYWSRHGRAAPPAYGRAPAFRGRSSAPPARRSAPRARPR